jgi:hypothetical protein
MVARVTLIPCRNTGGHREFLIDEDIETARVAIGIVTSAKVLKKHAELTARGKGAKHLS